MVNLKAEDSAEPLVINCHRRLGKSYLGVATLVEACIKRPGVRCVLGAPTYDQAREIAEPQLYQILETCPEDLRPKSKGYKWIFTNPRWPEPGVSTLHVVGVDWKDGDRMRGTHLDKCILDEVRDVRKLRYLVEEVLLPQFVGRQDPLLAMITTPPRSLDHEWVTYFRPRALETGRYYCLPGSKNPDFEERDRKLILRAIGGDTNSTAWRREVECELVANPSDLITPEWSQAESEMLLQIDQAGKPVNYKRPKYVIPLTCMDTGYDPDFCAIIFGYVDFINAVLVIEDEVFRRQMTLLDIHKAVRSKEAELWGKRPFHKVRRFADMDKRGLVDLQRMFKLNFKAADKIHAEAALARLRSKLRLKQVRVFSRCERLIDQLKHGVWNKTYTDFERTAINGHWDAGKALVYLNKMAPWYENPIPPDAHDLEHEFVLEKPKKKISNLLSAFGLD